MPSRWRNRNSTLRTHRGDWRTSASAARSGMTSSVWTKSNASSPTSSRGWYPSSCSTDGLWYAIVPSGSTIVIRSVAFSMSARTCRSSSSPVAARGAIAMSGFLRLLGTDAIGVPVPRPGGPASACASRLAWSGRSAAPRRAALRRVRRPFAQLRSDSSTVRERPGRACARGGADSQARGPVIRSHSDSALVRVARSLARDTRAPPLRRRLRSRRRLASRSTPSPASIGDTRCPRSPAAREPRRPGGGRRPPARRGETGSASGPS